MSAIKDFIISLPNLDPYGNPIYFLYLIVALLPIIIGLFKQRRFKIYETLITFIFIFFMFTGDKIAQGFAIIIYIIWQWLLVALYHHRLESKGDKQSIFYLTVAASILPLFLVKVTPLFSGRESLFGFLGISYLTFRSVGMIVELHDKVVKNFKTTHFLRFMLFMPTISSGPIDRYKRFEKDYENLPDTNKYLDMLQKAVWYLFLGAFYKFLLAHLFGTVLLPYFEGQALANGPHLSWPLLGVMYSYSLDLFFDFAGYSLFAVAISYFMGIETPMNFNQPFRSVNLKDFWNRWHMSLSFWFRDFVFMPLVMVLMKKKIFKKRTTISNVAYMVDFLIMGFWHGLTWYYIVYGIYHGLGMIINDAWLRFKRKHKWLPSNGFTKLFAIILTMHVVMLSFLIFSGFLDTLFFK